MTHYIGEKLRMIPNVHVDRLGHSLADKDHPCKVVYINREHRYFTVEFDFPGGKFRESYKFHEEEDLACNARGGWHFG